MSQPLLSNKLQIKPARRPDSASGLLTAAALLWLPQAAALALAVQRLAAGQGFSAVVMPALAVLLLGVLRAALEAGAARLAFAAARQQVTQLRFQVAQALAARSPLDRSRPASGLAASVIAEQAEAVVPWLVRYQPARWRVALVLPCIAVVVLYVSWAAALVLVLSAPLIPLFMALVGWRAQAASQVHLQEQGDVNAFVLDRLRGLSTLRALGAVDATALRLRTLAQSLRHRTMAVLRIAFLSSAVLELFAALGVALVAVYIGFHLLGTLNFGAWGQRLSLGEGLFVLLLAPAFFEPLRDLSAAWHDRAAGQAALDALAQLGSEGTPLPGALVAPPLASVASSAPVSVAVRGLHFAYPGEAAVFDNYHLDIAAGEHVALVGASGAGKSTLLHLLAGLMAPTAGDISLDNTPLRADSASTLRQRMAWMGQKPHVFAGSVQSNVALGRGQTPAQVQTAMQWAALDEVVQARPSTALGEGGSGLSGGEAARLALARLALAPQAGLLLVDEPTAHLDSDTAERVVQALVQLAQGKTLIVATHDPVLAARLGRVVQIGGGL